MMSNISKFTKCSGCGACVQICPADAIGMDAAGLYYRPGVNTEKCVDCGKCVQICPVNTPQPQPQPRAAWAGAHKDGKTVENSSSGGAFTALAETVLAEGGVVFGAAFEDGCKNAVITGTDQTPLENLRKSKYVESRTGDSFRNVKALLTRGQKVLYCGAPCQIAGLKRYLGREYDNLVTCDFSCGGMPSHKLYLEYLEELERRRGAKAADVDFRPKTLGWENYAIRVRFSNGKVYHSPARLDPYFSAFIYGHYSVGDLCLECPFSDNHYADITLADFWKHREFPGWEKPGKGLSLILAATPKGERLIEAAGGNMEIGRLDLEKAAYNIKKTDCKEEHLARREVFLQSCQCGGIWGAAEKHCLPSGAKVLTIRIKSLIRYLLRSVK